MYNIFKIINDRILFYKCFFLFGVKKYNEAQILCLKKIEKDKSNYLFIYILALCYFYKSDFEKSLEYFKQMLIKKRVKHNIQLFFIQNIISRFLFNNNYEKIIYYYKDLYSLINNKKNQILFLQYAYNAYFNMEEYGSCLDILNKIKQLNPKEKGLEERIKIINEKININQDTI